MEEDVSNPQGSQAQVGVERPARPIGAANNRSTFKHVSQFVKRQIQSQYFPHQPHDRASSHGCFGSTKPHEVSFAYNSDSLATFN